jgi:spore germination cell wall hydrolase CwlJ-like protein
MGRRPTRRMWNSVAALVPLPVIGFTCLAFVHGNPVALNLELYLSGSGSSHALTKSQATTQPALTRQADALFGASGKGPRADTYRSEGLITNAGKQRIVASLGGEPDLTAALGKRPEVLRDRKTDRLKPRTSDVALKSGSASNPLLMNASSGSMFGPGLDVDSFKPSAEEIAYSPTPDALAFRSQGETQAEFEERERRCLAVAIYFEARGEPERGQVAVGQVIMNRVRSPLFPETICGVVYQGHLKPGCQFSFTCDGKTDVPRNDAQWAQSQSLAKKITSGELWLPEVGYSTFYHANYVSPGWAGRMNKIDRIGRHIFYKKRNEKPYVVEALAEDGATQTATAEDDGSLFSLTPALSLVSAVTNNVTAVTSTVTSNVTAVTSTASAGLGASAPPTPAMSLGYGASE